MWAIELLGNHNRAIPAPLGSLLDNKFPPQKGLGSHEAIDVVKTKGIARKPRV